MNNIHNPPSTLNINDREFVDQVRRWRLGEVAYISGKVIHQFSDMKDGFEPLYLHSSPQGLKG